MEIEKQEAISCGEYLKQQRGKLDQITDLGAAGSLELAKDLLANIYAVNYQMMYERIEPPGPNRGPATAEPLDAGLVEQVAKNVRDSAPEFQDIVSDSWKLSEAIHRAKQGNGFPLVEMVNMAHLARTAAQKRAPGREEQAQADPSAPAPRQRQGGRE